MYWKHTFLINELGVVKLDQWKVSFHLWMLYNTTQKQKEGFSVNIPKERRKEEKKSTGLIFFAADLGMFSSGTVLNLLQ